MAKINFGIWLVHGTKKNLAGSPALKLIDLLNGISKAHAASLLLYINGLEPHFSWHILSKKFINFKI